MKDISFTLKMEDKEQKSFLTKSGILSFPIFISQKSFVKNKNQRKLVCFKNVSNNHLLACVQMFMNCKM